MEMLGFIISAAVFAIGLALVFDPKRWGDVDERY